MEVLDGLMLGGLMLGGQLRRSTGAEWEGLRPAATSTDDEDL